MKNLCDAPIHVQKRNRAEVEAQAEELHAENGTQQEKKRRIRVSFPAVSVRGLRLRVR